MADITQEKIHSIVEKQRAFFRTGTTLDIGWRKQQLKNLAAALEAAASGRTAGPLRKGHGFVVRPSRLLPGRAAFRSFGDVYETLRREERRRERRAEDAERK